MIALPPYRISFGKDPFTVDGGFWYFINLTSLDVGGRATRFHPHCVIFPPNYQPSAAPRLIVHFHGLRIAEWDAKPKARNIPDGFGTLTHFKFASSLPRDTAMLCPIGRPPPYAYTMQSTHGSSEQTRAFINQLSAITGVRYQDITISGHSAGGRIAHQMLGGGNTGRLLVTRVCLFDAMYNDNVTPYNQWLSKPGREIRVVGRKNDNIWHHSNALQATGGAKLVRRLSEVSDHWEVVNKYAKEFFA